LWTAYLLACATPAAPPPAQPAATAAPSPPLPRPSAPLRKDLVDTSLATGKLGRFVTAVRAAGLEEELRGAGPFTLLAPTDDAFDRLPDGDALLRDRERLLRVLRRHVRPGLLRPDDGRLDLEGARVLAPDIEASNGVLHAIDAVLGAAPTPILRVAAAHTRFLDVLERAGLLERLAGAGPFTLLAPTDEAFDAASIAVLARIDRDPAKLRALASRHVLEGRFSSADLAKLHTVRTLGGEALPVRAEGGKVLVGGAELVQVDRAGENGMVHGLSDVLVP
jgi:uncharacterized surface protein with fasciclin (FAS1) repeats